MTILSDNQISDDTKIPSIALWVGLLGVLPLLAFSFFVVAPPMAFLSDAKAELYLITYGAVIMSFLAGVRWGTALFEHNTSQQNLTFLLSNIPPLLGWVFVTLPFSVALPGLFFAYCAQGVWDVRAMQAGRGPQWYGKLRLLLTALVVSILLVVCFIRLFF